MAVYSVVFLRRAFGVCKVFVQREKWKAVTKLVPTHNRYSHLTSPLKVSRHKPRHIPRASKTPEVT